MDFVKANFSKNEIIKILELYSLNLKNVSISDLKGIANNNYRVTGKKFDIALKVYSHGQSDENQIKKELEILTLFGQKGIRVPHLIPGKNNKLLQKFKGFNIVATNFIKGDVFDSVTFTEKRMIEVGKIVAQVENVSKQVDIKYFKYHNFKEEFAYVSQNLETEISKRKYKFDLTIYNHNIPFIKNIIVRLDNSINKQFLHKDIWPWNLINAKEGIYLLDFNDWTIGDPIIELSVTLLEFSMFKSDKFDLRIARNIFKGYKSVKNLSYTPIELWESVLFICYLYFPYNVIQADDKSESEIYLKRITTLIDNPNLFDTLV